MTARETLAAVARTALLCGALGLALYLALAAFAEGVRDAHLWLTLAIGGAGAGLLGRQVAAALRTGILHAGKLTVYRRDGDRTRFWAGTGFLTLCTAALVVMLAVAVLRLAA